ncbi:MAG: hypothetical protein K1X39_11315 [Thermoflexales bacterium]|nr:hypothetical protein [Thermoflexales bacterium]
MSTVLRARIATFIVAALTLAGCASPQAQGPIVITLPPSKPTSTPIAPGQLVPYTEAGVVSTAPGIPERLAEIKAALTQPVPVLQRTDVTAEQRLAQQIALTDVRFIGNLRAQGTREPYRAEIFNINALRESDMLGSAASCRESKCYRVEMYNYALNMTTVAIVDTQRQQSLSVNNYAETQPDIPQRLTELAVRIATNAPEVRSALAPFGISPTPGIAEMANVKTALNGSKCERSRHLCVAPTFVVEDKALWAIVDLTDFVLVGTRWTNMGESNTQRLTEKTLQDEVVEAKYCNRTNSLTRGAWAFDYVLTLSDGMDLRNVRYNGTKIAESLKMVDWHVSYSLKDGFGYSDAVGCPVFSSAAVLAYNGPTVEDIIRGGKVVGFVFVQEYRSKGWPAPCNYNYQTRHEFYDDGGFRLNVVSLGRGCGNDGTYRPVTRLRLTGASRISEWSNGAWKAWTTEGWSKQKPAAEISPEGYQYRIDTGASTGFYLLNNSGQYGDGGRGDNALLYVTRYAADRDEGDSDLITIGPCCNTDYHQGPEKFIEPNPEPLAGGEIVLWYVAQVKNDDTPGKQYCWADSILQNGVYVPKVWPCPSGAILTPIR